MKKIILFLLVFAIALGNIPCLAESTGSGTYKIKNGEAKQKIEFDRNLIIELDKTDVNNISVLRISKENDEDSMLHYYIDRGQGIKDEFTTYLPAYIAFQNFDDNLSVEIDYSNNNESLKKEKVSDTSLYFDIKLIPVDAITSKIPDNSIEFNKEYLVNFNKSDIDQTAGDTIQNNVRCFKLNVKEDMNDFKYIYDINDDVNGRFISAIYREDDFERAVLCDCVDILPSIMERKSQLKSGNYYIYIFPAFFDDESNINAEFTLEVSDGSGITKTYFGTEVSNWALSYIKEAYVNKLIPDKMYSERFQKILNSHKFVDKATREEVAAIVLKLYERLINADSSISEISFPDIEASLYKDEILKAATPGLIQGTPDGKFNPSDNIKRVHVALMFGRLIKNHLEKGNDTKIVNVPRNVSFVDDTAIDNAIGNKQDDMDCINYMINNEYVKGKEEENGLNKFCPDDDITKEEVLIISERIYKAFS